MYELQVIYEGWTQKMPRTYQFGGLGEMAEWALIKLICDDEVARAYPVKTPSGRLEREPR
jgi:hypothetical protein